MNDHFDPTYAAALDELSKVAGARKFATATELIARIFAKTPAQVIQDVSAWLA